MCKVVKVPRSLVYYHINKRAEVNKISEAEIELENEIIEEVITSFGIKRSLKIGRASCRERV